MGGDNCMEVALVITPYTYHTQAHHQFVADEVMHHLGLKPSDVTEMQISEAGIWVEIKIRNPAALDHWWVKV